MKLIKSKLIKVESKPDSNKVMVHRLIFLDQHFDRGLEEWVPSSLNVKLSPDHLHLLQTYQKLQGQEIAVEVELTSVDRNVYYRTCHDGQPIFLTQSTSPVAKV